MSDRTGYATKEELMLNELKRLAGWLSMERGRTASLDDILKVISITDPEWVKKIWHT